MFYLLLFHGNNGYVNAPECCIMRILPVLFYLVVRQPADLSYCYLQEPNVFFVQQSSIYRLYEFTV